MILGVSQLYANLRAAGVRFGVERGRLRVNGPEHVLTESVYQQLVYCKDSLLELIESEPAVSDRPDPAAKPEDIARQSNEVPIEALFRGGVKAQIRRDGPGRYSIRLWTGRGWTKHKGSASPSPDHACRTAEQWYGKPVDGWHTVED